MCGNGILEVVENDEECDDSNKVSGDLCDSNCRIEPIEIESEIDFILDTSFSMPFIHVDSVKKFLLKFIEKCNLDRVRIGIQVTGGRRTGLRMSKIINKISSNNTNQDWNQTLDNGILYLGNEPNLTNVAGRVLFGANFPTDSSKPMSVLISASPPDSFPQLESVLNNIRKLNHRLLLLAVGNDRHLGKSLGLFYDFQTVSIPHWDHLHRYLFDVVKFVNNS